MFPLRLTRESAGVSVTRQALERDAAELLYRHGIGAVLVSLLASSGLAFISRGRIPPVPLLSWWVLMTLVLALRGFDMVHYHKVRKSSARAARQDLRLFGLGVIAAAVLWAAFPIAFLRDLDQAGRAYTVIVLCGMVGGSATVLAPSNALSLLFCSFLVLPTSILFLTFAGVQNTFFGVLGFGFFVVMLVSSRLTHRATMTAFRLSRANEALLTEMTEERRRTEAANLELKTAKLALSDANLSLELRIQARTAELRSEMRDKERFARELAYLASTDSLTGLCNRASLGERLRAALALAEREGHFLAVLFLDLDRFKEVNDVLGHMAGDQVLQIVAQRLLKHSPATVELTRWGGDEFVVTMPRLRAPGDALDLAHALSTCLTDFIDLEAGPVRIDVTIGIAVFPDHGSNEEDLIRAADIAMYASKEERGGNIRLFDPGLGRRLAERRLLERALREAIDAGRLSIVFQPIITAVTGRCEVIEALVRWQHPEQGPIPPEQFIPLAERTGEIAALGRWMLLHSCREAASWKTQSPPAVSVNVSAVQIEAGTLLKDVADALAQSGLPSSRLHLELTETVFAGDRREIIPTLTRLREMGVTVALDDFGTGFSCLADLPRLPIDRIKIDKSFVEALATYGIPIVKVIVTTARTFGLGVIAEGVENQWQAERLIGLGADYLQGYFFSQVLSPDAMRDWLLDGVPGLAGGKVLVRSNAV